MYIIILTYLKGLDEIEKHLAEHRAYLDRYYASGNFIVSGRQEPRIGGIILCKANSREQVVTFTQEDPFFVHDLARYEIIQFEPTKHLPGFEVFL